MSQPADPMNQPTSFTHAPGYGSHHPPAIAPTQTEDTRARYVPRTEAMLSIRRAANGDERVYLNAEAGRLLPDNTSLAELRHPVRARDGWELLTGPEARCNLLPVGNTGGYWFRAPVAVRALFAAYGPAEMNLHFLVWSVGNGLYRLKIATDNN